jgi:hypothetical protein
MGTQTQAICNSFKQAILGGSTIAMHSDSIKVALYTSAATLGPGTTAYTSTGEVTGTGYTAGGATLGTLATGLSSNTAWLSWASPTWTVSTLTGVVAALIYDSTTGIAIAVFTFASTSTTAGTLELVFPATGLTGLITLT